MQRGRDGGREGGGSLVSLVNLVLKDSHFFFHLIIPNEECYISDLKR